MPKTKKEAAAHLGVSERAIARYVERGKLRVRYEDRAIGGKLALYAEDELDKLKAEMDSPLSRVPKDSDSLTVRAGKVSGPQLELFSSALTAALAAHHEAEQAAVPIADKLMLSLAEAAALAGLSRGHLREAIAGGTLKAAIIGRGWRIKRTELDAYVKKL